MEVGGAAVQVPHHGGLGHRLVRVAEHVADQVGLVRLGDVLQLVEVDREGTVLVRVLLDVVEAHAACSSRSIRTRFSKRASARVRGTRWSLVIARYPGWAAASTTSHTSVSAAAGLPAPWVALVRSLTVEKVDSIGFVVRRRIQCSTGGRRRPGTRPGLR
ncbi:hypothetical protein [Streptomyces sp. NPDC016845]|uniref:hypothetical protein n=1 Tax=Streptomyces sp. NPDC016845 TaxID=3364972 RepID=UPI0037964FE4